MHVPVLLNEIIKYLQPDDNKVFLDCTFGAGGYTKALLKSSNCKVYAMDRDESVIPQATELKEIYLDRFNFILGEFGNLEENVTQATGELFDGIIFDLGVSSMQIDTPERGFSFYKDGPLDMRMSASQTTSAKDIIDNYSEEELARIFWLYGDERKSRLIAKKIVNVRHNEPIDSTLKLANLITEINNSHAFKIHPATRVFQALRIEVNDELKQLQNGINQAKTKLKEGGILAVVTFHSGEDILVKKSFKEFCGQVSNSNRHSPYVFSNNPESAEFSSLHKGVITPRPEEVSNNPRSRSAKLRIIVRK